MNDMIIELFKYSSKERELIPYIDAYMTVLENWLGENRMNDEQLVRYMLVGLFLHYRAANHMGNDFNTNTYGEWSRAILSSKTTQQFKTINKFLRHPIESTDEYLRLLQIKDVVDFTKRLFDFVIMGPSHLKNQSIE
jgi:hypothetical protein